eukprot:SAG31_NODE_1942_length_6858_cov_7.808404_6_plen_290_part_00
MAPFLKIFVPLVAAAAQTTQTTAAADNVLVRPWGENALRVQLAVRTRTPPAPDPILPNSPTLCARVLCSAVELRPHRRATHGVPPGRRAIRPGGRGERTRWRVWHRRLRICTAQGLGRPSHLRQHQGDPRCRRLADLHPCVRLHGALQGDGSQFLAPLHWRGLNRDFRLRCQRNEAVWHGAESPRSEWPGPWSERDRCAVPVPPTKSGGRSTLVPFAASSALAARQQLLFRAQTAAVGAAWPSQGTSTTLPKALGTRAGPRIRCRGFSVRSHPPGSSSVCCSTLRQWAG